MWHFEEIFYERSARELAYCEKIWEGHPIFFGIFWDVELWKDATSCKSSWSLGLFSPPPYIPIKGAFVIFSMCVRYQKKSSSYGGAWDIGS